MRLISNDNYPVGNRFEIAIQQFAAGRDVDIAVAFFSNSKLLSSLVDSGSTIRLVVRLNLGTSADALKRAVQLPGVQVRFFTSPSFHPKVYVIENLKAYVGSSNFTGSGMLTNQEANVEFDFEEPGFELVREEFRKYWEAAEVLTSAQLQSFAEICKKHTSKNVDPTQFIESEIGSFRYDNVGANRSITAQSEYLSAFRRKYQEYIAAFRRLEGLYEESGIRRFSSVPLRIEVDRFLWWIRETEASGNAFDIKAKRADEEIRQLITTLVPQFAKYESTYLDQDAVPRFLQVVDMFGDKQEIRSVPIDTMYDALLGVHAFHDRFRFFDGGHPTMKTDFLSKNTEDRIRTSFSYLLYGDDEYDIRIARCIFDPDYKLQEFGESCVKELFGIVNDIGVPISNGRTLKSMQWLGFGRL